MTDPRILPDEELAEWYEDMVVELRDRVNEVVVLNTERAQFAQELLARLREAEARADAAEQRLADLHARIGEVADCLQDGGHHFYADRLRALLTEDGAP